MDIKMNDYNMIYKFLQYNYGVITKVTGKLDYKYPNKRPAMLWWDYTSVCVNKKSKLQ